MQLRLLSSFLLFLSVNSSVLAAEKEGKTWAVLLCMYDDYEFSYAFEAATYHYYELLRKAGVPDKQIITVSPDNVAYHPFNSFPGIVTYAYENKDVENAPNYYENVLVDYSNPLLDEDDIRDIIAGNQTSKLREFGSGKVNLSGPKDTLFVFFIGQYYWTPSYAYMHGDYVMRMQKFVASIEDIAGDKFKKAYLIMDHDFPGMYWDDYVETNTGLVVMTLGGRYNQVRWCHKNVQLYGAYTSTCANYLLLEYMTQMMKANGGNEAIFDTFLNVHYLSRAMMPPHVVNLYGQLDAAGGNINSFMGEGSTKKNDSEQIDVKKLQKRLQKSIKNGKTIEQAIDEDDSKKGEKDEVAAKVSSIVNKSLKYAGIPASQFKRTGFKIDWAHDDCYSEVGMKLIKSDCFTQEQKSITLIHRETMTKLCQVVMTEHIIKAIDDTC